MSLAIGFLAICALVLLGAPVVASLGAVGLGQATADGLPLSTAAQAVNLGSVGQQAYGTITDDQLICGRILALFVCGTLAVYGHHEGMPALKREALAGLDRTIQSD